MASITLVIGLEDGRESLATLTLGEYTLGRDKSCEVVIASPSVSRRHARMTVLEINSELVIEVEDLGSTGGTLVNHQRIQTPTRITTPSVVNLGQVPVRLFSTSRPIDTPSPSVRPDSLQDARVNLTLNASIHGHLPVGALTQQTQQRLQMLYELPLQFAAETDLEKLYRLILDRVIELTPGAERGALLVKDLNSGKLTLRASVPEDAPPISRTLIRRAASEHAGFIWGDKDSDLRDVSASMAAIRIRTGMYAPLVWKGETVGVLFVDNPNRRAAFSQEDLQFLLSVAHYAGSAVANQLLQNEIHFNNRTLENLLTNFSPKIRSRLLEKSRFGRLQPGGEKSKVTILFSDLRGFTRTTAHLDASVVVAMLNNYFRVLGEVIFRHDGTIDKFMGDAILAVFGSPEPDRLHASKAVLAAVEMQRQITVLNEERQAAGLPFCHLGIGVHTGEVLHGFIGAEERLEFTVIGDTVNKASRYCSAAGPSEVLLGPLTYEAVQGRIHATPKTIPTKHEGDLSAFYVDWKNIDPEEMPTNG